MPLRKTQGPDSDSSMCLVERHISLFPPESSSSTSSFAPFKSISEKGTVLERERNGGRRRSRAKREAED